MITNMQDQVEFLKENLGREFNQIDFRTFRLFPWAVDSRTWRKIIISDLLGENVLQTRIEGEGKRSRYFIKGKNILEFINRYGSLMMSQIQKPKKWKLPRKKKLKSSEKK